MRALLTGVPQVQAFRGPWLRGIPRQGLPAFFCLDPGCRSRHAMVFRCWRPGVGCQNGCRAVRRSWCFLPASIVLPVFFAFCLVQC